MQPHCPSRKRRERSLRSAQTCEEKSCICSDWGMAEMTPKSPAVRQASITVDGHVANERAGRTSAWDSSIGAREGNCAVSYHCAPVRRPSRLASGTSVHEENEFVRESLRFVAATDHAGRTHRAEPWPGNAPRFKMHTAARMGPLLFVIRAEPKKGQGIRVRLLGLDSHYCHDDEQQIPAQGRTKR